MEQRTMGGKYLILGARGLVGRAVVAALEAQGNAEIVGLARGAPDFPTAAHYARCDLTDRADCETTFNTPELPRCRNQGFCRADG
ncbi:MAG: NAD-dependent epimerase/dehydratase family protein [Gammaproteobacteria bacterium]|nr:NAD-dependent epimerase/dehydratase family protein [Gammaproteobacteria bacterium]